MKYQHTIVYWIKGITLSEDQSAQEVASDTQEDFHAILTNDPESYCLENDRKEAIGDLVLNNIAVDEIDPKALDEYLSDSSTKFKDFRKKNFFGGPYLIFVKTGDIDKLFLLTLGDKRELNDFIICLKEIDEDDSRTHELEDGIRSQSHHNVLNTISAVTLTSPGRIQGIQKVSDSIVFFREDKKPIYSYIFWKSVSGFLCIGIRDQEIQSISALYKNLTVDPDMRRVCKLIVLSLEAESDAFRAFLFAWTALEIFTNKVFKFYEKVFFNELHDDNCSKSRSHPLKEIRKVMSDKYSISLKFTLLASLLCSGDSDEDISTFKVAKKVRDTILHGEEFDEATLPVQSTQYIVQKYLNLHIVAG